VEKAADPLAGTNNGQRRDSLGTKFKTLSIKIEGQEGQAPPDMPAVQVVGTSGARGHTPKLSALISPRWSHAVTPMSDKDVLMAAKVYTPKRGTSPNFLILKRIHFDMHASLE
jgi:hypothetical protein